MANPPQHEEMEMSFSLTFPAMRGVMGRETYYVAMVPLTNVPTLFDTYLDRKLTQAKEKQDIDMQREAQRRLNLKRIPEISEYMLDTVKKKSKYGYVFNSVTVNCEANLEFTELQKGTKLGMLAITEFDKFTVADGQHRILGIKDALSRSDDPQFKSETIAVVFFDVRDKRTRKPDIGRMHQIFTDLNRNAQKVQGGVLVSMGNQPNEIITRRLIENISFFEGLIESEKNNPSVNSEYLFSLNAIKQTVDIMVGPRSSRDRIEQNLAVVTDVWKTLIKSMPAWQQVSDREIDAAVLKQKQVCTHAVVLRALASIAIRAWQRPPARRNAVFKGISEMDWKKSNPFLIGKILNESKGIINNKTSERLLIQSLIKKFGLQDASE